MERPEKFTPEQIEHNKTRAGAMTRDVREGGRLAISDSGDVVLEPSENMRGDARREQENDEFREKYKDLIGKNVHVVFETTLEDAAPTAFMPTGWALFNPKENTLTNIDALLTDVSNGIATLKFEGKEIAASASRIKDIQPAD